MKQTPVLSIITVASGDSQRLAKTLDSLVDMPKNFEHVTVVPKEDAEGIQVWNDSKLGLDPSFKLCHDTNTGIYAAMNIGALASEGKYLVFWNAGDLSLSTESMLQLSNDLQASDAKWLIAQGKFDWISLPPITLSGVEDFINGLQGSFISHPTVFTSRKEFMNLDMYSEDLLVASDSEMTIKLWRESTPSLLKYPVVIVEQPNFAAKYHRVARVEQIIITKRNFRGFSLVRRLSRVVSAELRNFSVTNINKLGDLSTKRNSRTVTSPAKIRKISNSVSDSSFGRSLLCDAFQLNVLPLLPEGIILQVAVIGGDLNEPEIELLRMHGFEYEISVFGIDQSANYLDLNQAQIEIRRKYHLVLCSQVLEHIWNHSESCKSLSSFAIEDGLIWVSCPQSNRFHGSPSFYTAGFTHEYLREQFASHANIINSGSVGTERLYKATHMLPSWLSVRGHKFPLLFAFGERRPAIRFFLALRYLLINFYLTLQSKTVRLDPRWATESWILARSRVSKLKVS